MKKSLEVGKKNGPYRKDMCQSKQKEREIKMKETEIMSKQATFRKKSNQDTERRFISQ